jgi:hypothetical protein
MLDTVKSRTRRAKLAKLEVSPGLRALVVVNAQKIYNLNTPISLMPNVVHTGTGRYLSEPTPQANQPLFTSASPSQGNARF